MIPGAAGSPVRGPISWQQHTRLTYRQPLSNLDVLVDLPDGMETGHVARRLYDVAARQAALRITQVSLDAGGHTLFAPEPVIPLRHEVVDSDEEFHALVRDCAGRRFGQDGGPLWTATVVERPGPAGGRRRTLCGVFDHHVADGRSLDLFRAELTDALGSPSGPSTAGSYVDWLRWQHEQFPMGARGRVTPASEFWRRYLDGSAPEWAPGFRFRTDEPLGKSYCRIRRKLFLSSEMLRRSAARSRVTPFILYLAAVASAISRHAEAEDVTVRTMTLGRPAPFLTTYGWMSSLVPVRVKGPGLADPVRAVPLAAAGWRQVLMWQATPREYLRQLFADGTGTTVAEQPTVDLNFNPFPHAPRPTDSAPGTESCETVAKELPRMLLCMELEADDHFSLICMFPVERFPVADVRAFLDDLLAALAALLAGVE
ncbi:hypothetical protein GCM10017556_44080 [Micromonospora sagamiensis]|nr:hypothetical protein GCM10017556_44080 [Micromonospora sagamiensis]